MRRSVRTRGVDVHGQVQRGRLVVHHPVEMVRAGEHDHVMVVCARQLSRVRGHGARVDQAGHAPHAQPHALPRGTATTHLGTARGQGSRKALVGTAVCVGGQRTVVTP
jgi:hypothetical protein